MLSLGEGSIAPQEMTEEELCRQVEALTGQVICFRAYQSNDPTKGWKRYAGKLEKARDGSFRIIMGPEYNYLPCVVPQAAPLTEPIPKVGLVYTRIVASQVWVTEFAKNMYDQNQILQQTHARPGNNDVPQPQQMQQPLPQQTQQLTQQPVAGPPTLVDVGTWPIDGEQDAMTMETWLAVQVGFSPATAPPHALLTWHGIAAWIRSAANMGGWQDLEPFTSLGNVLVRQLRQQLSGISAATFRSGCADDDYENDPVGRVIAKHSGEKRQKRFGHNPTPQQVCSRCERKGHLAEKCFAKKKASGEELGGTKK